MSFLKNTTTMLIVGLVICFFSVGVLIYIKPFISNENGTILYWAAVLFFVFGLLMVATSVAKGWVTFLKKDQ